MNKVKELEVDLLGPFRSTNNKDLLYIFLKEKGGERVCSITCPEFNAQAILVIKQGIKPLRPLTHDIFINIFQVLNINIEKILVHKYDKEKDAYIASIIIKQGNKIFGIDCRPTDGVAIAVRNDVPIFVYEELLLSVDNSRELLKGIHQPDKPLYKMTDEEQNIWFNSLDTKNLHKA